MHNLHSNFKKDHLWLSESVHDFKKVFQYETKDYLYSYLLIYAIPSLPEQLRMLGWVKMVLESQEWMLHYQSCQIVTPAKKKERPVNL